MASLLSLLGLSDSSGLPATLTDEEQQQLAAQQAIPSSGVYSLLGVNDPDSIPQQSQQAPTSLLGAVAASQTDGSEAAPAADQPQVDSIDSRKPTTNDTTATAKVDTPTESAAVVGETGETTAEDSKPGFLSKLTQELKTNPTLATALMNAGFSMMGASRFGTPGLAAVGQGALAGIDTYQNLKQQQIANQMAGVKAQHDWALAQQKNALEVYKAGSENASRDAATAKTRQEVQTADAKRNYVAKVADGKLQWDPKVAASLGFTTEDIQGIQSGYAPKAGTPIEVAGPNGEPMVQQVDVYGNKIGTPQPKYVAPVQVSNGTSLVNPVTQQAVYDGGLTEAQQKTVNDAQTDAAKAATTFQSTNDMLARMKTTDWWGGGVATANDLFTKVTGRADEGQQLRGQLEQLANSTVVANLPPGAASDKDVALVRAGIPSSNASKSTWEAYLNAVGRVQKAVANVSQSRADYMVANQADLSPLKRDAIINGKQYKAGTSLAEVLGDTRKATQEQPKNDKAAPTFSREQLLAEMKRRQGGK